MNLVYQQLFITKKVLQIAGLFYNVCFERFYLNLLSLILAFLPVRPLK
jgi:hypothetical protein